MTWTTPTETDGKGPVDMAQLEEATCGDVEFIQELTEYFAEDTRVRLSEIQRAIETGDATLLLEAAHTIKGSSSNLGVHRVAAAALELEMMGREGQVVGAQPIYERLSAAFEEAIQALQKLCA